VGGVGGEGATPVYTPTAAATSYYSSACARPSRERGAVVGALSDPWLGLPEEDYSRLAETVDVIYHNGSLVNFVYPYRLRRCAAPVLLLDGRPAISRASVGRLRAPHRRAPRSEPTKRIHGR
jgi:hypothetical protein